MSDAEDFSIGPPVVLEGGNGEAVTASRTHIATLGATGATFWVGQVPHTVELPQARVAGARWSADGTAILAGTGSVDVARGTWSDHPAFAGLVTSGPPGEGSVVIRATSWSADRRHAAALLAWEGPDPRMGDRPAVRVVVLDLAGGGAPITLPADGASGVWIAGDRVVVTAPVVRVWTFDGTEVAALPADWAPLRVSGGDDGGPVLLFDSDESIRVVDTATWTVQARWAGHFLDAVAVPGGLIAADRNGRLHAGCLQAGGVREVGTAETGLRPPHLAVTGGGRIVVMGSGVVHVLPFRLRCGG